MAALALLKGNLATNAELLVRVGRLVLKYIVVELKRERLEYQKRYKY